MTDDQLRILGLKELIRQAVALLDIALEDWPESHQRVIQAKATLDEAIK